MSNKRKIILADDQGLVRSGLIHILEDDPDNEIIASAASGREVLMFLQENTVFPDLCILDIQMPDMTGIECLKLIKADYPAIKVILLTSYNQELYVELGLSSKADGYLLKDMKAESFKFALHLILDGHFIAPLPLMNTLSARLDQLTNIELSDSFAKVREQLGLHTDLDEKDLQIVKLIWQGWSNRMIGEDLYISEGTVKNYVSRIYRKLKINNRTELLQLLGSKYE